MKENFKWKANINWFKNNPQNINKKWRPKKGLAFINNQLKEKGYNTVTKQDLQSIFLYLLNLDEATLIKLKKNKESPFILKILIKSLLDEKRAFEVVEKLLDRSIWKAPQNVENKINNDIIVKIVDEPKQENIKFLENLVNE